MKSYLIFGVLLIVSQAVRGESQRISEFLEGSDGWRIFNALPDAGVAAGQVTVNSNNNPSYLILSNDVVFQLNAMKNVSSSLGLNMTIKIPQLCMAGDIDCKVILTLLGERCSISTQLAATSQVSSSLVDLLWYASAGRDVAASSWTVCSMLLAPYGYCTEQDAPSAMRAVMGTLRQVVLSVEVRCRYLCESMSFDFKLDSVAVAAQIEGNRMSSTRDRFPNIVGHLTLTSFPALSRCRDVRISSCIWDSCDASMQHLLEASCEGPYGMTGAHCWSQPFLMRYRLQMVGFKLQEATQTDIGCFQGSSCIEQIPLDVSNGVAISAEPMRSVWYWAAPASWLFEERYDENGNVMYEGTSLLDRVLQVEICNEHDLVSRKIENHTGDVVVVGRDGKCISFDYSDTPGPSMQIFSVPLDASGSWKSCGKTRTAAPSPDVVRVLGNPSWIFLRGAFYERRSNEDEDVRFDSGKGFLVGTRLGSVAILDSFINVKNVFPHLGPNSGGTRVVIEGEIAKMNANLKDYKCSWQFADKLSSTKFAPLTIVNNTFATCITPWTRLTGVSKFAISSLINNLPYFVTILPDFTFYTQPLLFAIQPQQVESSLSANITLLGRGFLTSSSALCQFEVTCQVDQQSFMPYRLTSPATFEPRIDRWSQTLPQDVDPSELSLYICILPLPLPLPSSLASPPPSTPSSPSTPASFPCNGSAIVSLAMNGADFFLSAADCPLDGHAGTGCLVRLYTDRSRSQLAPAQSGTSADVAGWVMAGLLGYILLGRMTVHLFVHRRQHRVKVGAAEPYSLLEAYVLWLFFGILGAHREYCGDFRLHVIMFACTGGGGGFLLIRDLLTLPKKIETCNRRRDTAGNVNTHEILMDDKSTCSLHGSYVPPSVESEQELGGIELATRGGGGRRRSSARKGSLVDWVKGSQRGTEVELANLTDSAQEVHEGGEEWEVHEPPVKRKEEEEEEEAGAA